MRKIWDVRPARIHDDRLEGGLLVSFIFYEPEVVL